VAPMWNGRLEREKQPPRDSGEIAMTWQSLCCFAHSRCRGSRVAISQRARKIQ